MNNLLISKKAMTRFITFFTLIMTSCIFKIHAVETYVPGTEAVMRAIAARANAAGLNVVWPTNGQGLNAEQYPNDGFYQNDSSASLQALGNQIVSNLRGVSTNYAVNPDQVEGQASATWQSVYASTDWDYVFTGNLYDKLSKCISILTQVRHLVPASGISPTLMYSRTKFDETIDPNGYNVQEAHTDTGWIGPVSFNPTSFGSSGTSVVRTDRNGSIFNIKTTESIGGRKVSYQGTIGQSPGGQLHVFLKVTANNTGLDFSEFGDIAADNLFHRVNKLSKGVGNGSFTTDYHPQKLPPNIAPLPVVFQSSTWDKGYFWESYTSDNSINWYLSGSWGYVTINFDTPNIGLPKPFQIEDKCDTQGATIPNSGSTHSATINTIGNSFIDNIQRIHYHTAIDFRMPSGDAVGCAPCGAGGLPTGGLPSLSLKRTHRYPDLQWHGSFGPGVFSNFDIQLRIDQLTQRAELFDPANSASIILDELSPGESLDGIYKDIFFKTIKELRMLTGSGTLTPDTALMKQALLTTIDGQQFTFDIFPETAGDFTSLAGRLTSVVDRNGNAITIQYVDHYDHATDASLNYDRQRLWRIQQVTDAYNQQLLFTYQRVAGSWVISSLFTPSGGTIRYFYNENDLVGLNRISYPDGTQSTFSTAFDPVTVHQKITMADAGAEDIHRNKTLYVTTGRTIPFYGLTTTNRAPNRIWQVKNGANEISYRNQGEYQAIIVYEGGGESNGTVKRIGLDDQGRPVKYERATEFSLTPTRIEALYFTEKQVFDNDNENRITSETYQNGERDDYVRNEAGSILEIRRYTMLALGDVLRYNSSSSYNAFEQPLIMSDRVGRLTEYRYDNSGNQTHKIVALGTADEATWLWTYNGRGQPLTATDANGNVTTYVYQETPGGSDYRRLISIIEPPDYPGGQNPVTTFTYDAVGRLATTTDPENRVVTRSYDARNRLQRITYHDNTYESWSYGTGIDANMLTLHRNRNGNFDYAVYDAAGRRTASYITDVNGQPYNFTSWSYLEGKSLVTSESVNGDTTTYDYDRELRQIAVHRHVNAGQTLVSQTQYGDDNEVLMETDPYGRRTFYRHNYNFMPKRIVHELIPGSVKVISPYELDTLLRLTTPNPAYIIEDKAYNFEDEVIASTDARNVQSTYEYDGQGRLIAHVANSLKIDGNPLYVIPNAQRTEFTYDGQGNRTGIIKPKSFTRDAVTGEFTLTSDVYATSMSYTGRNLLASVTDAVGTIDAATINYTYTLTGKKATESDPRNPAWLTTYSYYSCCNRLYQVTDPQGKATTYTYDNIGNVLSVRDANNIGVDYTYDAQNRRTSVTNTWGKQTTYTYDDYLTDGFGLSGTYWSYVSDLNFGVGATGSAVLVTNPLGEINLEIRDGLGRVVRRVDGNMNATNVTYDVMNNNLVQTSVTDALGNTTSRLQDGAGRSRVFIDALGQVVTNTFDNNGNQLSTRDANNVGWTVADDTAPIPGYDWHNRLLSRTDTYGDATSRSYDLHGNVLTTTDALNNTTTCTYDYRDRKVTCLDRVAGLTQYAYDEANKLIEIRDADSATNGLTAYTYDSRGLLEEETFPTGKDGKKTVRTYTYDNGGRLETRTVSTIPAATPALDEVTIYGYNTANLLTSRTYNDGKGNDAFSYDNAGRLTSAVSGRYGSTVVRSYNGNTPAESGGRLTSETLTLAGDNAGSWTVGYTYDAANRVENITYPTGELATRTYTQRHQLEAVNFAGATVATRLYDNGGRLTTTTFGNSLIETRGYRSDANGVDNQLTTQVIPGVTNFTYAYDANKRITLENNVLFPAQTQEFLLYDNENRLTSWKRGTDTQTWDLSKVGDWNTTTINGVPQTRTHSAVHEVNAIAGAPLAYDLKGNLTQNTNGANYTWDSENRLTSATVHDIENDADDVATYRYDALGRRVQKSVYGRATTFIHAGAQVIHEFDAKIQLAATAANDDGNGQGNPPGGGILQGAGITRINYQPALSPIPSGFFADKGNVFAQRSNNKSYGWLTTARTDTITRNQHPWPQFDSFNQAWFNNQGSAGTWEIALANGTYAVVVVMGDCASINQTNDVLIEGQLQTDSDPAVATPPGYSRGDFDGYAVTANVTDGRLTLSIPNTAFNPKLCFIEIGPLGSSITPTDEVRLDAVIDRANDATGAPAFPKAQPSPRQYVYGSYVDEPLMMKAGGNNYYYATNRLYSVSAITDQSGAVVERYKYDAYGKQYILADNGVVEYKPSDYGQFVGYTGRYCDWETELVYFRTRYHDAQLGRFINRNPWWSMNGQMLAAYDLGSVPPEWQMIMIVAGSYGQGSYQQGRYNLYDFMNWNPGNALEPFSYYIPPWVLDHMMSNPGGNRAPTPLTNAIGTGLATTANILNTASNYYTDAYREFQRPFSDSMVEYYNNPKITKEAHLDSVMAMHGGQLEHGVLEVGLNLIPGGRFKNVNRFRNTCPRVNPTRTRWVPEDEYVPFDPRGSAGAAKAWTRTGRLKQIQSDIGLPTRVGKNRYIPPESWNPNQPLPRGPNKGFIDKFGNEWTKGPSRTPGEPFEWDVQLGRNAPKSFRDLSTSGAHVNIDLSGSVTH